VVRGGILAAALGASALGAAGCPSFRDAASRDTASAGAVASPDSAVVGGGDAGPGSGRSAGRGAADSARTLTEMRDVDLGIVPDVSMHVFYLRGYLTRRSPGRPVTLDDQASYVQHVDTAATFIAYRQLANLLNRHVFDYDGAPLEDLEVGEKEDDTTRIELKANLSHALGVQISIDGKPEVTPDGKVRVRTSSIHALGISVGGLLHLLGLQGGDVVHPKHAPGVTLSGDDVILDPPSMLPPPRTRGRVVGVSVGRSGLGLTFGSPAGADDGHGTGGRLGPAGRGRYLVYRGGTVRIGRLTMRRADLVILDADTSDAFDFDVRRMHRQLQAGYVKVEPDGGLTVHAPDFADIGSPRARRRGVSGARRRR